MDGGLRSVPLNAAGTSIRTPPAPEYFNAYTCYEIQVLLMISDIFFTWLPRNVFSDYTLLKYLLKKFL